MFNFEVSSKHNVYIIIITAYMWKYHDFETIFTYNDAMNIDGVIWKWYGYQERAYSMRVNAYFGHRKNVYHIQHLYTDL